MNIDAYAPAEIAARVEKAGITKVNLPILQTLVLGVLAGVFIAFGGMFYTLVITDSGLGFGPTRLLGGIAFSTGLILVIIGGAELFTGNNLIVIGWAASKISSKSLIRNWFWVYVGNFIGALLMAGAVALSGVMEVGSGAVANTAISIAQTKMTIPSIEAFLRGVLCNILVCLAVWLCFAAHTVSGKILAIVFPISAFVALGFEHSVANMYLIPVGYLAGASGVTLDGFISNLIPVTLGNIVGGGVLVALVYWVVYLRKS
jgi:formate transporter